MTDFEKLCDAIGFSEEVYGQGIRYASVDEVALEFKRLSRIEHEDIDSRLPMELEDWFDEDGDVLWWKFPIVEPPYVGSPLDTDFPDYVTHWTRLEIPLDVVHNEG